MSALANDLTSLGMAPALASRVGVSNHSLTGVGTAQGGSSPVVYGGTVNRLTTAGGATACTIDSAFPVGQTAIVQTISATTGLLFPPSGGKINNGSANASFSVAQNKTALIYRWSTVEFIVFLSA